MNKWIKLLLGLGLMNGAIFACWTNFAGFGQATLDLLKGGIVWIVLFIGLALILLGINELKN